MTVSGRGRIVGILGWPIAHARSPLVHGYWIEKYGVDGAYVPLGVRAENFAAALRALPKLGFVGANVTVPHKEAALREADDVDPIARRIGAANTIVITDGRIAATNTDAAGFLASLREGAPHWSPQAGPALVVGSGGAARAVLAALADAGVRDIRVTNRTDARAETAAAAFSPPVRAIPWRDRVAASADAALLVNASSGGLAGGEPLDMPLDRLRSDAVVTDLVYDPLETQLLAASRARGATAIDGLGMLLHQARPGFAAWFGIYPDVTAELRRRMAADIERKRRP